MKLALDPFSRMPLLPTAMKAAMTHSFHGEPWRITCHRGSSAAQLGPHSCQVILA